MRAFFRSACREKYLHFRCLVYAECLHFHCLVYVTANFHCFLWWVMRRGVRCPKRTFILFAAQASKVLSDALCNWVPFVQFMKREKHPWRSVTFSTNSNTPPWVFFTFFKLHRWYQIAQRISHFRCLVYMNGNFHCFLWWVIRRGVRCPIWTFILFAA